MQGSRPLLPEPTRGKMDTPECDADRAGVVCRGRPLQGSRKAAAPVTRGVMSLLGSLFIARPWLALLPAAAFLLLYQATRRRVVAVAAVTWLCYALYEYGMHRRWLCSGECNIRIDLLLIYPSLLAISAAALVVAVLRRRPPAAPKR
jgi:hypothetical protein